MNPEGPAKSFDPQDPYTPKKVCVVEVFYAMILIAAVTVLHTA
jgi:hypothetical protein